MKTEINATIQDTGERNGASAYHIKKNYDGSTPLPDDKQEEYIHRIIFNLGNRKKSYEEVYYPKVVNPQYGASMPYRFFERKGFQKRYQFLMKQALFSAGIDHRTLLLKSATLIDEAIKNKDINGFSTMVTTILKLESPQAERATQKKIPVTKEDLAPVRDLLESLKG